MEQQTNFGLNDLQIILNLIQIVSSRGAIKPDEMETVGNLYSRLSAFVAASTQQPVDEDGSENVTEYTGENE